MIDPNNLTPEKLLKTLQAMSKAEALMFAKTEAEQEQQKMLAAQAASLSKDEVSGINSVFRSEATLEGIGTALGKTNMLGQLCVLISLWNDYLIGKAAHAWNKGEVTLAEVRLFVRDTNKLSDQELKEMLRHEVENNTRMIKGIASAVQGHSLGEKLCACPGCQARRAAQGADDPLGLEALERAKKQQKPNHN